MAWLGVITNNGNDLLTRWVEGKNLHITRAAAGQGRVEQTAMLAQSALVNEKQTVSIVSNTPAEKGQRLKLQVTAQAAVGYNLNQFGVWARLDEEEDQMIALFQTDTDIGIEIPSKEAMPDFVYTFYGLLAFSNQGNLTVKIDAVAVVTAETMGQAIAEAMGAHAGDREAHAALFEKKADLGTDRKVVIDQLPVNTPNGIAGLDKDGKVLDTATTDVKANTAYQWKFTPDSKNYDPIEGSITLYYVSTGGGGSTTYPVSTPSKTENGSVSVSPKNASRGDTVTITVKPDDGYVLDDLAVTDKNGNDLKLTDKGNGKYTFTMPAGKVEVKASFAEEAETSPFADVVTDAYYYEAVKWAAEQGITGGIGNNLFGPNQPCTRAQIVTFLWRAVGCPEPKGTSSFSDVPSDAYYAKAVAWAVENGITDGVGDNRFAPDVVCTRGQMVTLLYRFFVK